MHKEHTNEMAALRREGAAASTCMSAHIVCTHVYIHVSMHTSIRRLRGAAVPSLRDNAAVFVGAASHTQRCLELVDLGLRDFALCKTGGSAHARMSRSLNIIRPPQAPRLPLPPAWRAQPPIMP